MMGSLLTRGLLLVLGYAFPAYECYKTVELNKPEIEQLRFWCQYWILVAMLTVLERIGDTFVSWLPMYSEAKLAFYVYLWYPRTKGTKYVYDTFFKPYVSKHESEIDRNLLELKTRACDIVVLYCQKAASYGQLRFFEILQYVASQSQSQPARPRTVQNPQPAPQNRQGMMVAHPEQQHQQQKPPQQALSSAKSLQEHLKSGDPSASEASSTPLCRASSAPTPSNSANVAASSNPVPPPIGESMQVEEAAAAKAAGDSKTPDLETVMEEAIRVTRGRLKRRSAAVSGAAR